MNRPAVLGPKDSAALRERLFGQLAQFSKAEDLLAWAKANLPLKNTLLEVDARAIEAAYQSSLEQTAHPARNLVEEPPAPDADRTVPAEPVQAEPASTQAAPPAARAEALEDGLAFPKEPPRKRSNVHLAFVSGQPCLVWQKAPSDAHHLKFAQPRALGRKVSDEFTVPLCRTHNQALHRHGNERTWWADMQISPLPIAAKLWAPSPVHVITGKGAVSQ